MQRFFIGILLTTVRQLTGPTAPFPFLCFKTKQNYKMKAEKCLIYNDVVNIKVKRGEISINFMNIKEVRYDYVRMKGFQMISFFFNGLWTFDVLKAVEIKTNGRIMM